MEKTIEEIRARLVALETSAAKAEIAARKTRKRAAALHEVLRQAVADHGAAVGLAPDVMANITGPKVPPND